jgi:hypothetical protein
MSEMNTEPHVDPWETCHCDHLRVSHRGPEGHCEAIIIHGGRERDCVCRAFRFKSRSKRR